MQKENAGQVQPDVEIRVVIPEGCNRGSSTHPLFCRKTTNDKRGRFPIETLGNDGIFYNNKAFTLIELLVVVLIIGILAAVALPQYEKAVWKSRAATLRPLMKSIADAQNAYFMANGTYPKSFGELSVDVDSLTAADKPPLGGSGWASDTDAARYNKLFEIGLQQTSNTGYFRTGKYKGCGLDINYKTGEWKCKEWHSYYKGTAGGFCQKIMGAATIESDTNKVRIYPM